MQTGSPKAIPPEPPVPAGPLPPVPSEPPVPVLIVPVQPAPSGHGQDVSLAQLHVRTPAASGCWQTHQPILGAPVESRYWPPTSPLRLLHSVQCGVAQGWDACGVIPCGQVALIADGIA